MNLKIDQQNVFNLKNKEKNRIKNEQYLRFLWNKKIFLNCNIYDIGVPKKRKDRLMQKHVRRNNRLKLPKFNERYKFADSRSLVNPKQEKLKQQQKKQNPKTPNRTREDTS